MSTDETITDQDIENLRTEAGEQGDTLQVAFCDLALHGRVLGEHVTVMTDDEIGEARRLTQAEARAACEKAIREARALHAEYARG